MLGISMKLKNAINTLPEDNLIKISNTPVDQQIAFFAVDRSLDAPSLFQ
jgi:hypothetical protein